MPEPKRLPWARPRWERLLLGLVALAALSVVPPPNTQDVSRLCLSRALSAGHLYADHCLVSGETEDRARHGGHLFTDKAPGMSVLELLPALALGLPEPGPGRWHARGDLRLWLIHLIAAGIPFLVCVFLLGRIGEGLAPGYGGATAVVFGLGTEMGALGTSAFDHALTAALGLSAFLFITWKRPLTAGVLAGAAVLTEYEAAVILLVLLAYAALAVPSVIASTATALTWSTVVHYRQTVWGELARVAMERGSARLASNLDRVVLAWGTNRLVGAALVCLLSAAALAAAWLSTPLGYRRPPAPS